MLEVSKEATDLYNFPCKEPDILRALARQDSNIAVPSRFYRSRTKIPVAAPRGDRYQHGGKGAAPFSVIGNQDYYGPYFILHNGKVHFHRSAFFATLSIIVSDGKDGTGKLCRSSCRAV